MGDSIHRLFQVQKHDYEERRNNEMFLPYHHLNTDTEAEPVVGGCLWINNAMANPVQFMSANL